MLTLSRVPLSLAYPFNALGYIGILTASVVFLHERTNVWTWLGTFLVAGGLVLVVTMTPRSVLTEVSAVTGGRSRVWTLSGSVSRDGDGPAIFRMRSRT